jgi:predicted NBD/HSP70 family sugar kinase
LPTSQTLLGFDLGGTKIAAALYDTGTWKELAYEQLPTDPGRGFDAVVETIVELIGKMERDDTVGVGVGVPGLLAQPEGRVLRTPNIPGGENYPLAATLRKKVKIPVAVDNDARCFTLAESAIGAGKGGRVVVGITMGTGVGGGIVVEGKVFHGEHGFAGEMGHMLLRPGEPPYPTDDRRGDVEQFFSGTAMGKRCAAANRPEEYLEGKACSFLHPLLFREISWMISSLTYMLDPSVIVFGGSAGLALKPHLGEIEEELQKWLLPGTPMPTLKTATVKHAGTVGAAMLLQK